MAFVTSKLVNTEAFKPLWKVLNPEGFVSCSCSVLEHEAGSFIISKFCFFGFRILDTEDVIVAEAGDDDDDDDDDVDVDDDDDDDDDDVDDDVDVDDVDDDVKSLFVDDGPFGRSANSRRIALVWFRSPSVEIKHLYLGVKANRVISADKSGSERIIRSLIELE